MSAFFHTVIYMRKFLNYTQIIKTCINAIPWNEAYRKVKSGGITVCSSSPRNQMDSLNKFVAFENFYATPFRKIHDNKNCSDT